MFHTERVYTASTRIVSLTLMAAFTCSPLFAQQPSLQQATPIRTVGYASPQHAMTTETPSETTTGGLNGGLNGAEPSSSATWFEVGGPHAVGASARGRNGNCNGCNACEGGPGCGTVMRHPDPLCVPVPSQTIGLSSGTVGHCYQGVDSAAAGGCEQRWKDAGPIDFEPLRHGEYIGPVRLPAMLQYRIRAGDDLQFIYTLTREQIGEPYRLMVGDELLVESATDDKVRRGDFVRGLPVQPDGMVVLHLLGPVPAAGKTVQEFRKDVEKLYSGFIKNPAIDITPVKFNTKLEDLRNAVSNFIGVAGGQNVVALVNPDGRIQLPLIGNVYVVGMTLEEIKREVNLRYRERVIGIELEPRLIRQAPHFVYVFGQVTRPGRFEITQPTTVTQALAMAEGLSLGANNRQVVIFRRTEDWRLIATMLDLRGAHLGKRPSPADEIWLRDNDLIVVPPKPIRLFNNFVRQVFTEGIYGAVPPGANFNINGQN